MKEGFVMGLILLVLVGAGALSYGASTGWTFSAIEQDSASSAAADCALDTIATINLVNKYNGSAVGTPTYYYKVGDGRASSFTSASTKLVPGQSFELLASKTDYIDSIITVSGKDIKCGGSNIIDVELAPTSTLGMRVKNDDGDFMTDNAAGGAINQTDLNVGERLQVDLEIPADSDEDSGNLVFVVEMSEVANVTSIEMSGASKVGTPSFYSNTLSNPKVQAFSVEGVKDNQKVMKTITAEAKSGKDIQGAVYITAYSEQAFKEKDGSLVVGIEDIDGNTKYEDTYDVDFFID